MARVGSLFAGVGCTDLGLQWAGHETAWAAEQDPYRQQILAKRYGCPVLPDVHLIDGSEGPVEIITGGFPCQDVSPAGLGAGITGSRSTLYTELIRAVKLHRPKIVLIENVTLLTKRGLERVLVDLHAIGYAAEWDCIPAMALGAPHMRDRIWILAYPEPVARSFDYPLVFGPPASWHVLAQLKYAPTIWPRAGMARDGLVYELQPSAPTPLARARFASGSFPAPAAGMHNYGEDPDQWLARQERLKREGKNPARTMPLGMHVRAFPTPRSSDAERGGRGDLVAHAKGRPMDHSPERIWPTPNASDVSGGPDDAQRRREQGHQVNLKDAVREAEEQARTFKTPTAAPWSHGGGGGELAKQLGGAQEVAFPTPRSSGACNAGGSNSRKAARERGTYISGQLNPEWVEWLMGLPTGHTDVDCDEPGPVHPWPQEPAGIPRITAATPNRTARNAALGDGLVPQIPALIMGQLPEEALK